MALARHRELSMEDNLSLDSFPLRNERQDIFAIRHPYDYIRGSLSASSSEFSYNSAVRNNFLHLRFNQHAWEHRKTCFKKGDECRANLPSTTQDEFELDFDEEKDVNWPMVNCNDWSVFPFAVLPKRIFADQYLNVFNKHISDLFGCNNNIQIGDLAHLFYNTIYGSKSTQRDDTRSFLYVSADFTKRVKGEIEGRARREAESDGDEERDPEFLQGLFRLLNGVRAHMASTVISATMAHFLSTKGSRFHLSHQTQPLLLSQLEDLAAGREITYYYRRSQQQNNGDDSTNDSGATTWPDSFADNYLQRPDQLTNYCTYSVMMHYKVIYKGRSNQDEGSDSNEGGNSRQSKFFKPGNYYFLDDHPSKGRSHMREFKHEAVPVIYSSEQFPDFGSLEVDFSNVHSLDCSPDANLKRETWARMALMLFFPFRKFEDLKKNGSYWQRYWEAVEKKQLWKDDPKYGVDSCNERALNVLQNIQDKLNCKKLK